MPIVLVVLSVKQNKIKQKRTKIQVISIDMEKLKLIIHRRPD